MNSQASITALMSSFGRAFHAENEYHPVFVDPLAKELMTAEEYESVQGYILNGARFFEPDLDTSGLNRAFLQPSMILAESVQTISKGRLIRPMGRLSIPELIRLNYALLYQLDLNEWVWRKEAYERYLRYHR